MDNNRSRRGRNQIKTINTPKISKKNKKSKSNITIGIVVILLFVLLISGIYINNSFQPPDKKGEATIAIEPGSSVNQIGTVLEKEGVIRSALSFKLYSRFLAQSQDYKAGDYKITLPINVKELSALLVKGSNVVGGIKVTIPEGYILTQIASLLESKGLGNRAGFLELAKTGNFDFEFLNFNKTDAMKYKLEGFIYPDTYFFNEKSTNEEILNKLLEEFNNKVWAEMKKTATARNVSPLELLTIASIVEKEAVLDTERGKIAGVFFNRLDIKMKLQSCATVQYALNREKFATVVTIAETKLDNPYNTYLYAGLPPGPICNPGIASIKATLSPEKSDYLFFVAKGDGGHQFSKTYEEHLKAIDQYQK